MRLGNGTIICPPGTLWFNAGVDNRQENYAGVSFEAPTSGRYRFEIIADPLVTAVADADNDLHLVVDGKSLDGRFLPPDSGYSSTNSISLAKGGRFEVLVGRGANRKLANSSLKLQIFVFGPR